MENSEMWENGNYKAIRVINRSIMGIFIITIIHFITLVIIVLDIVYLRIKIVNFHRYLHVDTYFWYYSCEMKYYFCEPHIEMDFYATSFTKTILVISPLLYSLAYFYAQTILKAGENLDQSGTSNRFAWSKPINKLLVFSQILVPILITLPFYLYSVIYITRASFFNSTLFVVLPLFLFFRSFYNHFSSRTKAIFLIYQTFFFFMVCVSFTSLPNIYRDFKTVNN